MTVYLVNIALILFLGVVMLHAHSNDKKKKLYCIIVSTQWALISGLRDVSVGADTENYKIRLCRTNGNWLNKTVFCD